MAYPRSDPEVKAWMKEHGDEVGRIEKLYNLLKDMEHEGLEELARDVGVDVPKHWERFRAGLITAIVKANADKALEIVLGQGVLLPSTLGGTNKRG